MKGRLATRLARFLLRAAEREVVQSPAALPTHPRTPEEWQRLFHFITTEEARDLIAQLTPKPKEEVPMKRLITFEPHYSETYTPTEVFVNLYLEGPVAGSTDYASLEFARDARLSFVGGVTLRIARDVAGDFTVTKEEEF